MPPPTPETLTDEQAEAWRQVSRQTLLPGEPECTPADALRYRDKCDCYTLDIAGHAVLVLTIPMTETKTAHGRLSVLAVRDVLYPAAVDKRALARALVQFAQDIDQDLCFLGGINRLDALMDDHKAENPRLVVKGKHGLLRRGGQ